MLSEPAHGVRVRRDDDGDAGLDRAAGRRARRGRAGREAVRPPARLRARARPRDTSSRSSAFGGRWLRIRPFGWLRQRTAGCRIASTTRCRELASRGSRCPAWRLSCTQSSSASTSSGRSSPPSRPDVDLRAAQDAERRERARWQRRSPRPGGAARRRRGRGRRGRSGCGRRSRGTRSRARARQSPSRAPTPCRPTTSCGSGGHRARR